MTTAQQTTTLPTVTREQLPSGKFRYSVDGEVHTAKSGREYTHASVYRYETLTSWDRECGRNVGDLIVFLHGRADLAFKGSSDANRIAQSGHWSRVPGVVTIQAA
jgi:hypothetical protein